MKTREVSQSGLAIKTFFCLMVLLLCLGATPSLADEEFDLPPENTPSESIEDEKTSEYVEIWKSVETALNTEKEHVAKREKQLAELKISEREISARINAYRLRLSNHNNLLASSEARIEDIENAWADTQTSVADISDTLGIFTKNRDEIRTALRQTEVQLMLNEKHVLEINTHVTNVDEVQRLVDHIEALIKHFTLRINLLESLDEIYTELELQLRDIRDSFSELLEKFDHQIKSRKKEALFERKEAPLISSGWEQLREELKTLLSRFHLLFSKKFWSDTWKNFWGTGGFLMISSLLLFAFVVFLLFRIRPYFMLLEEKYPLRQYPWRHLLLQLLHRSLFLLGSALFLFVYADMRDFHAALPFFRTVLHILLIWLFSGWVLDFLKLWNQREKDPIPLPLTHSVRSLLMLIRCFGVAYVTIIWLRGHTSIILFFVRVLFEASLFVWGILFWRSFQKSDPDAWRIVRRFTLFGKAAREPAVSPVGSGGWLLTKTTVITLGLVIVGTGIFLEIFGYGSLALYWFVSWGCTVVVCLWGVLSFLLLHEGHRKLKESFSSFPEELSKPGDPIRWFVLKVGWLVWAAALLISLLFAWGTKQTVIVSLLGILTREFSVGDIRLSPVSFVYALLVLLFTHAAIRIWQNTLIKKLLAGSGLRSGLRDSIRLITVYVFWLMGILISLNVLGFSTKSFALAFGGLGIGLGFGLQNIFNNFISGLILLFERPIEVGDAIEINGIWGEVKKINVRSTLVQTYDYSDMIIPNSDFISSTVTNWTYKDRRIRRKLVITVAYGSDIERVSETLLEIAENEEKILKYPKAYVLFTDFGDSALRFELRFWTDVDSFPTVESQLRFEIDRLFRERDIKIPFPQRDVHLRSGD